MTEEAPAPRGEGARIYRPTLARKLLYGVFGALMIGLGIAFAVGWLPSSESEPAWAVPLMSVLCFAFGALTLVALAVDRIVLHGGDEIELWQLGSGRHRLRREEIRGRRVLSTPYVATLVLERADGGRVKIDLIQKRDEVLNAFLDSLPDLEQLDRAAAARAVLQMEGLGATEAERRQALVSAHRVARVMNGIAIGTTVWAYLYPRPYTVAVLVLSALPLAALVILALGRGRFSMGGSRHDPRPHLVAPLALPSLILCARSILDHSLVDFGVIASVAATIGVIFTVCLVTTATPDERRWGGIVVLAFVAAMYGWGATSLANVLPDRAPPRTYAVEVRGARGRNQSAYLTLAPWGPVATEDEYTVGREVYDHVEVGGNACASLHRGALGARWYVIRRCE